MKRTSMPLKCPETLNKIKDLELNFENYKLFYKCTYFLDILWVSWSSFLDYTKDLDNGLLTFHMKFFKG